jgi:glycerate dehydrogenase
MLGVILDAASLGPDINLSRLLNLGPEWQVYADTPADLIDERIQGANLVLTNKVRLSALSLGKATQLQFIGVMATGVNNVDLKAAQQHNIIVSNAVGYATPSVVQHTMTLILALATRLNLYRRDVQAGNWQQSKIFCLLDHPILELNGKTLGIVGLGELGSQVAKVAECFGMRVLVAQSSSGDALPANPSSYPRLPLEQLLPQVDILSLHCPWVPATDRLINAHTLRLMKPSALLINTARGGLVDSTALLAALQAGTIAGAGIDVLPIEPPTQAEPLLTVALDNLIITPHTAWAGLESRQRLLAQVCENVEGFLQKTPCRQVVAED